MCLWLAQRKPLTVWSHKQPFSCLVAVSDICSKSTSSALISERPVPRLSFSHPQAQSGHRQSRVFDSASLLGGARSRGHLRCCDLTCYRAAGVAWEIAGVGFSAAMHSLLVVDANGYRLTNSIIWADNRSIIQNRAAAAGMERVCPLPANGNPIHPMSPLTKLMWMRDYDLDTFRLAAKFLSIKEYIFYQLFGLRR